jgi:pimeloyl-ACP methyl ester carboxylesterase
MQNQVQKIYAFSGLGADHQAFQNLRLEGYKIISIAWKAPQKRESFPNYIKRLTAFISDDKPIFMGISFGGLAAMQAAHQFGSQKLLLISTFKSHKEMAATIRWFKIFPIYRLLPSRLLRFLFVKNLWVYGPMKQRHRRYLQKMLYQHSGTYFKWAFDVLLSNFKWVDAPKTKRWHGKKDALIPKPGSDAVVIENAGHLLPLTHGRWLSKAILEFLNES